MTSVLFAVILSSLCEDPYLIPFSTYCKMCEALYKYININRLLVLLHDYNNMTITAGTVFLENYIKAIFVLYFPFISRCSTPIKFSFIL